MVFDVRRAASALKIGKTTPQPNQTRVVEINLNMAAFDSILRICSRQERQGEALSSGLSGAPSSFLLPAVEDVRSFLLACVMPCLQLSIANLLTWRYRLGFSGRLLFLRALASPI